ncbi:MAG: hypothetical protein FWG73_02160 [Planctomycetaceae bacterium]|nr:hypothetical protein [Planctomycetaceae bacterium]
MTDELNPKLREFEAKLRQLKPLDVVRCAKRTADCRRPSFRPRIAAYALATATLAILVVCLLPQPQPVQTQFEPAVVLATAPQALPTTSPSIRQQFAQLLDELYVANSIAAAKPSYPVVEIVVCDAPAKRTPRDVSRDSHIRQLTLRVAGDPAGIFDGIYPLPHIHLTISN